MKKRAFILTFIALLCVWAMQAQKTLVWEEPATAYSKLSGIIDIARLELGKDQTIVTFHIDMPAGTQVYFTEETMLLADGKEYKIKAIREFRLNESFTVPEPGYADITLLFEAVPPSAKSITFTMPGAFSISNIHDRYQPKEGITDTYWRNEQTGDWMLGVTEDAVIYDNKVWEITSQNERKGNYSLLAKNGSDILSVQLNKKKEKRIIRINGQKALCSLITSDFLPDYPTKDAVSTIADNGYRMGDSITIIGWYKDMPQEARQPGDEFTASYTSIFMDKEIISHTRMDSLGRFTLRMPVENTSMLYCDTERCGLIFPAEPNETYFLLKDFAENKTLIMGRNARLQNEYIGNQLNYKSSGGYQRVKKYGGLQPYLSCCDSLKEVALLTLDAHTKAHPTLSGRYGALMRNSILAETARDLMQAKFSAPEFELPKEYVAFVTANYWNRIEEPFTMTSNSYSTFFRDYTDDMEELFTPATGNILEEAIQAAEKEGILDEADRKLLEEYKKTEESFNKKIKEAPDSLRQKMADEFSAGETITRMNRFLTRNDIMKITQSVYMRRTFQKFAAVTDSLGWRRTQREMFITTKLCDLIDRTRQPLTKLLYDYASDAITLENAKRFLFELNDKYEAIDKRQISAENLQSADIVKDLSEGAQILRKILEPYKGRIVLLDIWGTWCGPCKEALSHSQEEYERLKPYDMVFLYLANNSNDESWKNVIKEYNVTGENVVHYNLPDNQQKAIESHLGVRRFPTYKLFDQQGNLLDVNADPRDLDALEGLVKRIKK